MKGIFTQSSYVLLDRPVTLDAAVKKLGEFELLGRQKPAESWAFGGPAAVLAMPGVRRGRVVVDVVDQPWPDGMGDPKADPDVFGAWGTGQFGPFVWPGSLARACRHAWSDELADAAQEHQAFIRVRSTHAAGSKGSDPILADDSDATSELLLVTQVALALLGLKGAVAYFNPNGESLRDGAFVREQLDGHDRGGPLPLLAWVNRRLFHFDRGGWSMTDLVGLQQLDAQDMEACYPSDGYDHESIPYFLYNTANTLVTRGVSVQEGMTTNNPYGRGEDWEARTFRQGKQEPPRPVVRWFPCGSKPPKALLREDR